MDTGSKPVEANKVAANEPQETEKGSQLGVIRENSGLMDFEDETLEQDKLSGRRGQESPPEPEEGPTDEEPFLAGEGDEEVSDDRSNIAIRPMKP
jgi:hypothetical protein